MDRRAFFASLSAASVAPLKSLWAAESNELPFRQVHLDFHTSERIQDVGSEFGPDEFAEALKTAKVNSINIFAKCHHGLAYYETKLGTMHPSLKRDMLAEMVRVLHQNGIQANYYYSLVWDVNQWRKHPEWVARNADGSMVGGPLPAWPWLCMNTPYLELVVRENEEIVGKYDVDGAFFDILKTPPGGCHCRWCKAERQRLAIPDTPEGYYRHGKLVARRVMERLNAVVKGKNPKALTFYNSRVVIGMRDELPFYSHLEIESLPTGGWGYSHFQQRVRYLRTLGKDMVGMTGRFHKSWGDFGGLKNQAALDYECLNFLANGCKVCVGDQLHPRGRLDKTTYERIGRTYAKIEALEPYAKRAVPLTEIGVISTAATNRDLTTTKVPPSDQGFTNLLLELHHQFDVLDLESDFRRYRLLIIPDEIKPNPAFTAKLKDYLRGGGALIVSHHGLLDPQTKRFALDELGVTYQGPAKYQGEYMSLQRKHFPAIDQAQYFLYQSGSSITEKPGTEILATYTHPYFDRSADAFVSHKQTPPAQTTAEPLITKSGNVIYIANPFFLSYSQDAFVIQKQVVGRLIEMLLPDPLVKTSLPSSAQVTLLRQNERLVSHVLYYPLTRRAPDIDIIEEPGLLDGVELKVRVPKPRSVRSVPQETPLPFTWSEGYATIALGRVIGHQALVIEADAR